MRRQGGRTGDSSIKAASLWARPWFWTPIEERSSEPCSRGEDNVPSREGVNVPLCIFALYIFVLPLYIKLHVSHPSAQGLHSYPCVWGGRKELFCFCSYYWLSTIREFCNYTLLYDCTFLNSPPFWDIFNKSLFCTLAFISFGRNG